MLAASTIIAIDDIYPGPQPELPRNLVVCSGTISLSPALDTYARSAPANLSGGGAMHPS